MYIIITNETRYVCRREDDFRLFNLLTLKACRPRRECNVRGSRGRRQGLRQKKIRNCYFGENDWHAVFTATAPLTRKRRATKAVGKSGLIPAKKKQQATFSDKKAFISR